MKALLLLVLLAAPAGAQTSQPAPLAPPFFDRGSITLRNATGQPLSWSVALATVLILAAAMLGARAR